MYGVVSRQIYDLVFNCYSDVSVSHTFEISTKAALNCQRLTLAFWNIVDNVKTASKILRPLRNPNCSLPSRLSSSIIFVILWHILTVSTRSRFDGTMIGL